MERANHQTLTRLETSGPALATDDWSLGDAALELVLAELEAGRRTMVECGSGRSTVICARLLAELGDGTIHSLEHDPAWAAQSRELLAAERLAERATVIEAPLAPHPLAGAGGWYEREALGALPNAIDLLLVDGPPAGDPGLERSRHPALAELGPRLAPGATILLDDARRAGEAAALERWASDFELEFELDRGSGTARAQWPLYC